MNLKARFPRLYPLQRDIPGGYREVAWLAFPAVLSTLSHTLMWVVDTFFLGRLGTVPQGAAGLGGALVWPLLLFCNCNGAGVNIFVAQYVGARQRPRCGVVTWQGVYLSVVAWLPMLVGGLTAAHLVLFANPDAVLVEPTTTYLRIRLLGSLPALLNFVYIGFFRGIGDTKTPLLVTLIANLLNVGLDLLLIFGYAGFPRLEVAGSALATVLASLAGSGIYLMLFLRRGQQQGFLARRIEPPVRQECWRLVRMSVPVGLSKSLEVGAWTVFTALVAQLGAAEAAAHQIAMQVMAVSYMSGYGLSVAAMTLVGQYLGARDLPAARRSMASSLGLVVVLMGGLGLLFFYGRYGIMALFTLDPLVQQLGVSLLVCVALLQIFDGLTLVSTAVLHGAGETRWPMLAGLIINWGFFVPLVVLVRFIIHGDILRTWVMALVYAMLLGLVMLRRVLRGAWQERTPVFHASSTGDGTSI
jgi:putative MATE family efflux protein